MNEHPVPRNVTGFQFQLIGFMTLKQFGYLAAGALLAFAFYNAPISFFRFPIAAFFLFVGLAFAFIPVQERPLDEWVVNLIKSVYEPTQFVWEKEAQIPAVLQMRAASTKKSRQLTPEHQQDTRAKLNAYLATIGPGQEARLDARENQTLARVSGLFGQPIPVKQVPAPKPTPAPFATLASKLFSPQAVHSPQVKPAHHTTVALQKGIITGIVKTAAGPITGLLIHIMTEGNQQARLLKTDKNGRFGISLPLDPGKYHMLVEDPTHRYSFKTIAFEIGNEGLHPWLIMPTGETH